MNYIEYKPGIYEILTAAAIYAGLDAAVSYFFYRSFIAFFVLLPGFVLFYKRFLRIKQQERLRRLSEEFAETLYSVSNGMNAGYSMENAFLGAYRDLKLFYRDKSIMAGEILIIRKGLGVNMTLEDLIDDLAKRSGEENIAAFSDVLKCAKRYGGNVTEVLRTTAEGVREKIRVDKEIKLLITEKKLELRMMEVLPFFILMYLGITSVGYFDVLYEGLFGRIFMTACLFVYGFAVFMAEKLMRIRV